MPVLYFILISGLVVGIALLLYFGCYVAKECVSPRSRSSTHRGEGTTGYTPVSIRFENENNNVQTHLTSTPSAPILTDLTESSYEIRSTRRVRESFDEDVRPEEMRAVQAALLRNEIRATENDLNCHLIIGVSSNNGMLGGYCVNMKEKWIKYYAIKAEDLPWRLVDQTNRSEFDMKNLLFSLTLWMEEIQQARKFLIHTGNPETYSDSNRYGRRAAKLLEHYSMCQGIVIVDESRLPVSRRHPEAFAVYIQPVEDLCNGNLLVFREFLSSYYRIDKKQFEGTHVISPSSIVTPENDIQQGHLETTENYRLYLEKANRTRMAWTEPCPKCCYVDDETLSMLNIDRIT